MQSNPPRYMSKHNITMIQHFTISVKVLQIVIIYDIPYSIVVFVGIVKKADPLFDHKWQIKN